MTTSYNLPGGGGGEAPGGISTAWPAPAPAPAPTTLTGTYTPPVLYPAPVVPVQPGTPTGTGTNPTPVYSPAPDPSTDCVGCVEPASSTPSTTRAPLGAAPVLRAEPQAEPCELCAWIRGWPWWVWLLLAVLLWSLWNNRRAA